MLFDEVKSDYYLRGAYGPGNLGDDVLMVIMTNILQQIANEEELVTVTVDRPEYVANFNLSANFVNMDTIVRSKITVLGGGGQFFSFAEEQSKKSLLKKIKLLLTNRRIFKKILIKLLRQPKYTYEHIAGIGMGIGPFENSNDSKYESARSVLSQCDFLSVRDSESLELCREMDVTHCQMDTDLAFYTPGWIDDIVLESLRTYSPKQENRVIALVLRTWPFGGEGGEMISHVDVLLDELKSRGYNVTLVSLYPKRDQEIIKRFKNEEWLIWEPKNMNFKTFLFALKECASVVLSTRAHGVMLASIIGLPAIALAIEPKLKNISKLLPNSVEVISVLETNLICTRIEKMLIDKTLPIRINQDVELQRKIAQKMIEEFKGWINENR